MVHISLINTGHDTVLVNFILPAPPRSDYVLSPGSTFQVDVVPGLKYLITFRAAGQQKQHEYVPIFFCLRDSSSKPSCSLVPSRFDFTHINSVDVKDYA
jgi:hypothetical protein